MGIVFERGDDVIWSPSNLAGEMYLDQLRTLERLFGVRSGIDYADTGTLDIDEAVLQAFVDRIMTFFPQIHNDVIQRLTAGCCEVTLALLEKTTGTPSSVPPNLKWMAEVARSLGI